MNTLTHDSGSLVNRVHLAVQLMNLCLNANVSANTNMDMSSCDSGTEAEVKIKNEVKAALVVSNRWRWELKPEPY